MTNKFADGIKVNNGSPNVPSISFLSNPNTGVFLRNGQEVSITTSGLTAASFHHSSSIINTKLQLRNGAQKNSVLTSVDNMGNAEWKINQYNGIFQWNKLYKNLDLTKDNNVIDITFPQNLSNKPSVILTKESDAPVRTMDLFIRNKTTSGFQIYSDKYMSKVILEGNTSNYSACKLADSSIGICYYDIYSYRMKFLRIEDNIIHDPIIIDDTSAVGICYLILIEGKPSVVYVADDGDGDTWRFVRASDADGTSWNNPVNLLVSSIDVNFITLSIFLVIIDNKPAVFLNNDSGRAIIIIANDVNGATWGSPINISNLVNHEIIAVKLVNNIAAIVARSNITKNVYYVKANNAQGTSWPSGATQLYRSDDSSMKINSGHCCNTMEYINGKLCIVVTEDGSNNMYIAREVGTNGTTWGKFELLTSMNSFEPYPYIFKNNNDTYLIYNDYIGQVSKKNIIKFNPNGTFDKIESFIESLPYASNHQVINCSNSSCEDINIIILTSEQKITLLKFYGDDYVINWVAYS